MHPAKKNILAISGSTREHSVNELILQWMAERFSSRCSFYIYNRIADLPHFRSDLIDDLAPDTVKEFYGLLEQADGVVICTPEYVFSLPGAMKNALEWTVSTTLFSGKLAALIVASSLGEKAFEALHLVMTTLGATIDPDAELLISGVKTKINLQGQITDEQVAIQLEVLGNALLQSVNP